ncbi:MAG: permease-like cell division protein FtsX [Candidatus Neomarinimicrobiota bacterium]|nr:permease-like cell division protein FtsX [Candidatus Neomarinimicrobiota bacterium]
MIDRFLYLVTEGIRSLWRSRTTALATTTAIGISASFVLFIAVLGENLSLVIDLARDQYEFQVFFNNDLNDGQAAEVAEEIAALKGVTSVSLITKDRAAEIFEREFGENILDLIQDNPLPTGCAVTLEEPAKGRLYVEPVIKRIQGISGVDEVRIQGRLISMIERYYEGFLAVITAFAAAVLFGTVVLISNTIRLSIFARRDLIRILKLVGATDRFVRFPFMIEGLLAGLLGSFLAAAVSYGFVEGSNYFLSLFTHYHIKWYIEPVIFLAAVITVFALFGSMRAVRKFL